MSAASLAAARRRLVESPGRLRKPGVVLSIHCACVCKPAASGEDSAMSRVPRVNRRSRLGTGSPGMHALVAPAVAGDMV